MENKNDFTISYHYLESPQRPLRLIFEVDGDYTAFGIDYSNFDNDKVQVFFGMEKNEDEWAVYVCVDARDEYGEPITECLDVDDELKRVLYKMAEEYIRDTKNMSFDDYYAKCERETLADLIYLADLMM